MATGLPARKVEFKINIDMSVESPKVETTEDKIVALRAQIEALEATKRATSEVQTEAPVSENQEVATATDPMQAERQSASDAADLATVQERLGMPVDATPTNVESERQAYQNEAEIRATERNENRSPFEKLKFWDRNTSIGMLQEEANMVNKLADEERVKNPSMTEQEAAEKVLSSPEFGHKLEGQIAVEEEAAKLGVGAEFLSAIKNHDIKALLDYREKLKSRKNIDKKEQDIMHDLEQKEIAHAMSSGDPEVISIVADKFTFKFDLFKKIPEQVRGDERIQKVYLKAIEWDYEKNDIEDRDFNFFISLLSSKKERLEKMKTLGLTDATIATSGLREKANEQLMRKLRDYILTPEGLEELLRKYADIGLTKNASALIKDPVMRSGIKESLKRRVEWENKMFKNKMLPNSAAQESIEGYIKKGFISREEAKADPVLAAYA